jgi:putative aldouronate transport system permease protein
METGTEIAKPKKKKRNLLRYAPIYVMGIPGIIYLIANNYLPMFGIVIAFKKLSLKKGIFASDWAGLDNFAFLFKSNTAWSIIRNTLLYNVAFIILGMILAVAAAILLNEVKNKYASKTYQTVILLPFLISWVIISYLVYAYLATDTGLVNHLLGTRINFYNEKKYWPFILTFVNLWKGTGYSMIIYFAGVVGISADYYEAARIDGSGEFRIFARIVFPLSTPIIATIGLMTGIMYWNDWTNGLYYLTARGGSQ